MTTVFSFLFFWTITGMLAGLILTVDKHVLRDYTKTTVLLCLWLGPFWWFVLLLTVARLYND